MVTPHYVDSSEWELVAVSKRTIEALYECCEVGYLSSTKLVLSLQCCDSSEIYPVFHNEKEYEKLHFASF